MIPKERMMRMILSPSSFRCLYAGFNMPSSSSSVPTTHFMNFSSPNLNGNAMKKKVATL